MDNTIKAAGRPWAIPRSHPSVKYPKHDRPINGKALRNNFKSRTANGVSDFDLTSVGAARITTSASFDITRPCFPVARLLTRHADRLAAINAERATGVSALCLTNLDNAC
jgi:hypothetical protein